MLTPTELKSKQFSKAFFGGYSMQEVDEFLDALTVDYEKLHGENAELSKKVEKLVERLASLEEREESIKAAIVNTQRMCDNMTKQANQSAELIERDAKAKGEKMLERAEEAYRMKESEIDDLHRAAGDFREQLVDLYRKHLALITELPVYEKGEVATIEKGAEAALSSGENGETYTREFDTQKIDLPEELDQASFGAEGDTVIFESPTADSVEIDNLDRDHADDEDDEINAIKQPAPRPIGTDAVELMADDEEDEDFEMFDHNPLDHSLEFGPNYDLKSGTKVIE